MPKGKWETPESGDLPEKGKSILAAAYASCRDKQYEMHGDSVNENEMMKESCAKQAWGAVHNAGYSKGKDGKWGYDEGKDMRLKPLESETIVSFGGDVKALDNGVVAGYLVRFTTEDDPDLTGDFFQKDTDFGEATTSSTLYHHGLDIKVGTRVLGKGKLKYDDIGVWIESQLAMRDEYEKAIYELAKKGKLGWSSGTASHLVARKQVGNAWKIMSWPLGLDASLTPRPAEPRNEVIPLKSLSIKSIPDLETELASVSAGCDTTTNSIKNEREKNMDKDVKTPEQIAEEERQAAERLAAEKAAQKNIPSGQVDVGAIMQEVIENQNRKNAELKAQEDQKAAIQTKMNEMLETVMKSAPATNKGGTKTNLNTKTQRGDDAKKAFNHFLRTGDAGGIRTGEAYEQAVKTDYNFEEGTQYYGQEVVPTEIVAEIAKLREPLSVARAAGCRVMPVGTATVWLPKEGAVVSEVPTANEKGEFTEDTAKPLDKTIVTIAKKAQSIMATTEVLEDSVVDLSQYLSYRWGKGLAKAENASFLTAIAASSTLGVTAASHTTVTAAEVVKLYYALPAEYRDSVSWLTTQTSEAIIRGLTGNWFQFVPNSVGGYPAPGQPTGWLVDPRSKVFNYGGVTEMGDGAAKSVWCFNGPASTVLCERRGMTILRDPYSAGRNGEVWFTLSARFGFGVVDATAIVYMLHPTA